MKLRTVELPAFLGPALINGDVTGLSAEDEIMLATVLARFTGWHFVSVGDAPERMGESHFGRFPAWLSNLSGDCAYFTLVGAQS